jgi:alpha-beta hydrolase superfamily lysophospholipase
MPTQHTIRFISDDHQLVGDLHIPDTGRAPVVIGCHGLLANRQSPKQITLAAALNNLGLAYLRFDHRGCGDSQGTWDSRTLLADRCRDLYHAILTMQSHSAISAVAGLFGSSFGGTIAMATAAAHPVPRIVTYAAPITSSTVHQKAAADQIQAHNALSTNQLSALAFDIRPQLPLLANILVLHAEDDEIVPCDHARQIYQAAREPKKLILFSDGDHRLSDPNKQHQFVEACADWYRVTHPWKPPLR